MNVLSRNMCSDIFSNLNHFKEPCNQKPSKLNLRHTCTNVFVFHDVQIRHTLINSGQTIVTTFLPGQLTYSEADAITITIIIHHATLCKTIRNGKTIRKGKHNHEFMNKPGLLQ